MTSARLRACSPLTRRRAKLAAVTTASMISARCVGRLKPASRLYSSAAASAVNVAARARLAPPRGGNRRQPRAATA